MISIIDASGPTDWTRVTIPPGRSVKAVRCMIDITKKQVGMAQGDSTESTPNISARKAKVAPKAKMKAAPKAATNAAKVTTKRKRGACEPEGIKEEEEEDGEAGIKKVKNEEQGETVVDNWDLAEFEDNFDEGD